MGDAGNVWNGLGIRGIRVGMRGIGVGMQGIRVGMRGIRGNDRGIKIKGNERIYKNIVLTFSYEKQLKKQQIERKICSI